MGMRLRRFDFECWDRICRGELLEDGTRSGKERPPISERSDNERTLIGQLERAKMLH